MHNNYIIDLTSASLAPICIFVYNRPQHTEKMLKSLMSNPLFEESEVFVFADGPKENAGADDLAKINDVRKLFEPLKERKNVFFRFSDKNLGLTTSIVSGITEIVNQFGKVIVIEDDLELSSGFLKYMNYALNLYENEKRVMHIGGYMVPHNKNLPETFFLRAPTIWGWGTWKRAWHLASFNPSQILEEIKMKGGDNSEYEFNVRNGYPYYWLLNEIGIGRVNAWSPQWYATIFLNNGLCLIPKKSLVKNIGFDNSGTNCEPTDIFIKQTIENRIEVKKEEIDESENCIQAFLDFWKSRSIQVKIVSKKRTLKDLYHYLVKRI